MEEAKLLKAGGGVQHWQVVFGTGELGLEFYMSSSGRPPAVSNVRGQAKSIGVKIKDSLVRIGENDIEPTITQEKMVELLKGESRPMTMVFTRKSASPGSKINDGEPSPCICC